MTATTSAQHLRPLPRPGRYRLDPGRSHVRFSTRHLFGLAPVRGSFPVAAGAVTVSEPVGGSLVQIAIDATGFRTGSRRRDDNVRSPRFLATAAHPTITFQSEGVVLDATGGDISGALTVRDVTRPVRLRLHSWQTPARNGVCAGSFVVAASARIDRRMFGITASRGLAGRFLVIEVSATCVPA